MLTFEFAALYRREGERHHQRRRGIVLLKHVARFGLADTHAIGVLAAADTHANADNCASTCASFVKCFHSHAQSGCACASGLPQTISVTTCNVTSRGVYPLTSARSVLSNASLSCGFMRSRENDARP